MIGIPYKNKGRNSDGCDCYGLVCLFNKNVLNKDLPNYQDYLGSLNEKSVDISIEGHKKEWKSINRNDILVGDLVLFRVGNLNGHCGVMINKVEFIHVSDVTVTSQVERLDNPKWNKRIRGFFRYDNN